MSNTFNDENDDDTSTRQAIRADFNRMFAAGRSFSGNERNCCYLNTKAFPAAAGRFANVSAASGIDFPDDGRALVVVDWDDDGDLDVWTSNRNAPRLRFLRNNADHTGHFLSLRLVGNGRTTNRDAIGARVEVVMENPKSEIENPKSIKTLRAGEGFLSQSSKWLHFGLAAAQHVEKVVVNWPGGQTEEFRDFTADRRYELVQNSGQAKAILPGPRSIAINADPQQIPTHSSEATIRPTTPIELPPLPFQTWQGGQELVQAMQGKALLVNFWASSCQPCLQELAEFAQSEDLIRSTSLDILALSVDGLNGDKLDPDSAKGVLDAAGFNFRSGKATRDLIHRLRTLNLLKSDSGKFPLPFSVLIDYRGRVAAIYRGPTSIEKLLADIDRADDDILDRFQRAASMDGRVLRHQVARQALHKAEIDGRFQYAIVLRQSGLLDLALIQYEKIVEISPESENAHSAIGALLSQLGNAAGAMQHLERALQINPNSLAAHVNLGGLYANQQRHLDAKKHYNLAIDIAPHDATVLFNRATVLDSLGESDAALRDYAKATELKPDFSEAYFKRGAVNIKLHQYDAAVQDYSKVLQLEPEFGAAYKKRGVAYLQMGKYEQSLKDLAKALELMPKDEELYNNRGMANAALGQFAFALIDYAKAIELNPNAPQVYNNLAWLLATCPDARHRDGEKALANAKRACELSQWSYFGSLDTLAAAYAEMGRFDDAVKWQKKSLQYAPKQSEAELQSRLELYQMEKPYRQPGSD